MEVVAQKISKKSLFKLLATGLSLGFLVFFSICGVAAIFGAETVHWNEEPITGLNGLITALLMWPFFSLFFTGFIWLVTVFGLWIYSFAKPVKVSFKNVINNGATDV